MLGSEVFMPGHSITRHVRKQSSYSTEAGVRKKETRITFEHHEMIRVKRGKKSITRWCEKCRERVQMIPAEEAAILKGQSLRWLIRRLEAEELHFIEDPDCRLFICLNALLKQ